MVKKISAEEFDERFDAGEDMTDYLDPASFTRPGESWIQRVNLDLPKWMVRRLDNEAKRLGIPRQSVIKVWLDERLQHQKQDVEQGRQS